MSADAGFASEKRQKLSKYTDRISNLPRPVLYHILSRLPTIDAVATSSLSRSWRCHWRNIHNLYFRDIVDRPNRHKVKYKKLKFVHFVNRVLILLNQQTIDKAVFKIEECCMQYDLSTWITSVVARKLKVLEISLGSTGGYPQNQLPSCIFTCNTLEVLVLCGIWNLKVPSLVCLPNLKTLRLERVGYQSNESFQTLLSGCLSLEALYIDEFRDLKITTVISLPNLKTLHLRDVNYQSNESVQKLMSGCSSLETLYIFVNGNVVISTISSLTLRNLIYTTGYYCRKDLGSKLEIKAPGLQYLNLSDWLPRGVSFDHPHSLIEANIETDNFGDAEKDRCSKAVLGFFEGVCNVKVLKLCRNTIKVLDHAGASLWLSSLTRLTVKAECCSLNWLLKLVEQSCQLEFLELRLVGVPRENYHVKTSTCSSISLKRFVIDGFSGQEEELAVIAFFLKNAKFLTMVTLKPLYNLDVTKRSQLLQKVSEFPRISISCQITFS